MFVPADTALKNDAMLFSPPPPPSSSAATNAVRPPEWTMQWRARKTAANRERRRERERKRPDWVSFLKGGKTEDGKRRHGEKDNLRESNVSIHSFAERELELRR